MQILRAFQIIKQDGMYKVTTVFNTIDENGKAVKINNRRSDYLVDADMALHAQALDEFLTGILNAE